MNERRASYVKSVWVRRAQSTEHRATANARSKWAQQQQKTEQVGGSVGKRERVAGSAHGRISVV